MTGTAVGGFRLQSTEYRLVFAEGHLFEGLEVMLRPLTVERLLSLNVMGNIDLTPAGLEALEGAYQVFSESVIRWNLEDDDGKPVATTVESLRSLDIEFMTKLIASWLIEVAGVTRPKAPSLPDGPPSEEAFIPMEVLSESLST